MRTKTDTRPDGLREIRIVDLRWNKGNVCCAVIHHAQTTFVLQSVYRDTLRIDARVCDC